MRIGLKILFSVGLILTACVSVARAQNAGAFREALMRPDTLYGSTVRITENGSAAEAVGRYRAAVKSTVQGYRIRIFFSNSQTAREDAKAVQRSFRQQFTDIPSYLVYDNPAFIVTVGNCVTMEEALILQNQLKGMFGTAFLWRGEIPVGEFLKGGDPVPLEEQTVTAPEYDSAGETI